MKSRKSAKGRVTKQIMAVEEKPFDDAPILQTETGDLFAVYLKDGKKLLRPFKPAGTKPGSPNKPPNKTETRKCFKCLRKGHIAANCTYATKPDGSPSNPSRPKDAHQVEETTNASDNVVDASAIYADFIEIIPSSDDS